LTFPHHRSGWAYALDALKTLIGPNGAVLDTFIEATFCWNLTQNEESGLLPYRRDWIAFIHNPPGIPEWHDFDSAPQSIFHLPVWIESFSHCRGIYTFSQHMCSWLKRHLEVPVEALIHPTETPDRVFNLQEFVSSTERRVVQIGSWLRRLHSIARLRVKKFRKTILVPRRYPVDHLDELIRRERENDPDARAANWSDVEVLLYQDSLEYDELLSRNIVFLDLYDTVVNNTVLECMVRATPLVCRRLPALIELLGYDYPLFFTTLEEAAALLERLDLLELAHYHLQALPKQVLSQSYFRDSLVRGGIYQGL
jgi:hypothetical protein